MSSDINILPVKTGPDVGVQSSGKGNKSDTTSFEKVLQDAKLQNDTGIQSPDNKSGSTKDDVLEKLDKAIQFLTKAENDKTLSPQLNVELQKLISLLKTVKADVTTGKTSDTPLVKNLLATLSNVKNSLQNKDGLQKDDHLEKLLDDFKKKVGTNPIDFIQTIIQQVIHPVQQVIQPIAHTVKPTTGNEKVELQGGQSTTPKEPNNKFKSGNLAKVATPQTEGPKQTTNVDSKDTLEKATIKSKVSVTIGSTSEGKKQSLTKDGESSSSQSNQSKSLQWVSGGPVNKIQQFILHSVPKTQSPAVQISNQVREIISKGIMKPLPDGGLELTIKLHPANLGTVQVVLSQTAAGLQATLLAQSQSTKDLLQSQLSQLKQSFATLGINVQKLDVSQFNQPQAQQNPSQFNGQAFQQSSGDGHGGQRRDRDDAPKVDTDYYDIEPESTFDEWLKEGGII